MKNKIFKAKEQEIVKRQAINHKKNEWLNVYCDCETFKYNKINELDLENFKPTATKAREHEVSYYYRDDNNEVVAGVVNTWQDFHEMLMKNTSYKNFRIFAHNGEKFDFWFIRKSLMVNYGINPMNRYERNSVNHDLETRKKDLKGWQKNNYLLESHVKSKSRVKFEYAINGYKFITIDTLPKFMCSIKELGFKIIQAGLHDKGKLDYSSEDYARFDKNSDMTEKEVKAYQRKIWNELLSKKDLAYSKEDAIVLGIGCENYSVLYKGYDFNNMTLSQGISHQYVDGNPEAEFQILHALPNKAKEIYKQETGRKAPNRLNYSEYIFMEQNGNKLTLAEYIRLGYKGGLNLFNPYYCGKILEFDNYIKHIDLNSSYPTVMHEEMYPYQIIAYSNEPKEISVNNQYLYLLAVSKKWANEILRGIKSKTLRMGLVKRFNELPPAMQKRFPKLTECIYITNVDLMTINSFRTNPIGRFKKVPVMSYIKWNVKRFAAWEVIDENYKIKNQKSAEIKEIKAKIKQETNKNKIKELEEQLKLAEADKQNAKILLNGLYGIPALRPYFPLFEKNEVGEFENINNNNGFKNSERNIAFSIFVTAYALRNLLKPLTYNKDDIDKGFIYADTDSLFLTNKYWNSIKSHVNLDHTKLGAWDLEHSKIKRMYVMNHKKYAIEYYDDGMPKIEVHAGGVPLESFESNKYTDLNIFVKEKFHEGYTITGTRSVLTADETINIYDSRTVLQLGTKNSDGSEKKFKYSFFVPNEREQIVRNIEIYEAQTYLAEHDTDEGYIYIELSFGDFAIHDLYGDDFKASQEAYRSMEEYIEDEQFITSFLFKKGA